MEDERKKQQEEDFSYAMQLVNSAAMPMVLNAAIQLGIFDIIANAGGATVQLSPSEIASHLPANNNPEAATMVDRMLRLLTAYSIFTCSLNDNNQRVYGLSPVAKYFVPNQDGASLAPLMALVQDKVFIDSWFQLKDAVLEGGSPFDRVHGTHAFDYPAKDSRFNQVFNKAMINHTTIVIKEIVECYKGFAHLEKLVDVGGGLGVTLKMITSKYPNIRGINFDLPHVIRHTPSYQGVEHVGGDMFESVPSGDAILMKWILHDWSDDHCLKLLKNCYKALPDNGKVFVVEAILPVIPDTSPAVKSVTETDMVMMTQTPGGKERTEQEFLSLAKGAGFTGITLECFACNFWVMEFYK